MLNLIRADIYKLLKSTSFRVCGVLFLLLHPLLSVAGHACPATLYLKIPAPTESPVSALQLPTWY